jgi:hypothetical protein
MNSIQALHLTRPAMSVLGVHSSLTWAGQVSLAFLAAADPDAGVLLLCTEDGRPRRHSYPDLKLQSVARLPGVGYQAACDGRQGRLYVACSTPGR